MTDCQFDKEMPIRLDRAARIAFPDGSIRAYGLRKESEAGRLETFVVAGKHFTTLAAIERMKELCRVQPKALTSTGLTKKEKVTEAYAAAKAITSSTAETDYSLASAVAFATKLKNSAPTTARRSTRRSASASATPTR